MSRLPRIVTLALLTAFAAMPALSQTAPVKPKNPGEIAAADEAKPRRPASIKRPTHFPLSIFAEPRTAIVSTCPSPMPDMIVRVDNSKRT
jgi:hypothetical protein